MAKYVCDFGEVTSVGEKVIETATTLEAAVNTYSSRIESDLASWTGTAKDSFKTTNASQVSAAVSDLNYVKSLGDFIKNASKSIEELETQLAALSI